LEIREERRSRLSNRELVSPSQSPSPTGKNKAKREKSKRKVVKTPSSLAESDFDEN
jgi:hypothetical protein